MTSKQNRLRRPDLWCDGLYPIHANHCVRL